MSEEARRPGPGEVVSPFAGAAASLEASRPRPKKGLRIGLVCVALLLVAMGAFFVLRYFNDPYRTLEPFPVGRYLENYRSLAGSKFKADVRVEADLGWKEHVGRLMVFSSTNDGRSFVVLIPPNLAGTFFTKGQTYSVELEVREGGLIYANSFRKN